MVYRNLPTIFSDNLRIEYLTNVPLNGCFWSFQIFRLIEKSCFLPGVSRPTIPPYSSQYTRAYFYSGFILCRYI